jgi:signal transduction histidine kinase
MKPVVIYTKEEASRNAFAAEKLCRGLGAELQTSDYDGAAAFVVNRTNDYRVAQRFEARGIRVLNSSGFSRLANDMVELSRFQSGTFEFHPTSFDLTEIVRRIVISFEQKIVAKNIEIDMDIPDVLNIFADRDSIFRVVYNLTDNAVKFTNQNGRMSFKITQNSSNAVMSIENSGTPIPPDEAKNVFERFYKLDKSRSENKHGAGLGLYIAKTIITAHKGVISVSSKENEFTAFKITIPIGI